MIPQLLMNQWNSWQVCRHSQAPDSIDSISREFPIFVIDRVRSQVAFGDSLYGG